MRRVDVEIARRADGPVVDMHDERDLRLARERRVEPAVEPERVHVREPMDLGLALRCVAQAFAVPLLDWLDAHDLSLERTLRAEAVSTGERRVVVSHGRTLVGPSGPVGS